MANLVKTKFAALLRGLLRRFEGEGQAPEAAAPAPAPAPAPPASAGKGKQNNKNFKPATLPAAKAAAPAPSAPTKSSVAVAPATPVPPSNISSEMSELELPLAPIIASLPAELRGKVMSVPAPNITIRLSVETVVSQLAFGAVKITFGELRQMAPGYFANTGGEHDVRSISLPLGEIIKRVNPALLSRRSTQAVQVSEAIAGPFGDRGKGFQFTTQPLKPSAGAPAPAAAKAQAPAPAPAPVTPPPAPEPPKPIAFKPQPSVAQRSTPPPSVSAPVPSPAISAPKLPPQPSRPAAPAPISGAQLPPVRMAGSNPPPVNGNKAHTPPPPAPIKMAALPAQPIQPVRPAQPAPAPAPQPAANAIYVRLADLMEKWPDAVKSEVAAAGLSGVSVPLPPEAIEPGMKRGRVAILWEQIRQLVAPQSPASANDAVELELPLRVVAPLFLAAQKNAAKPQARATVSAEIPDLFYGFQKPAAPPPAPAPSMPLPAAVSLPPVAQMAPKSAETNFFPRAETVDAPATDFSNRQAQPKDIVMRAMTLPGIAGVVLALPDGLLVASQVPAGMNAEALAGFLPQIFERVNQATRELRMGALNNVNFTVGNIPWRIFRVNAIYFAAFGRAGESLPSVQLAQMAAELDRRRN